MDIRETESSSKRTSRGRLRALSKREWEIIQAAADGRTDAEIARQLGLSIATVGSYWSRIRAKLQVCSRTHAVGIALRQLDDKASDQARNLPTDLLVRICDASPVAICVLDATLRYVFVSDEATRALGVDPEEIVGRRLTELDLPADVVASLETCARSVLETGRPTTFCEVVPTPRGPFRAEGRMVRLHAGNSGPYCAVYSRLEAAPMAMPS